MDPEEKRSSGKENNFSPDINSENQKKINRFFSSNNSSHLFKKNLEEKEREEVVPFENIIEIQKANMPVPPEKKNDEAFKLLKIKQMKKESLPPYQSTRANDANLIAPHRKEFNIGKNIQ
jgi:hypothetical protein